MINIITSLNLFIISEPIFGWRKKLLGAEMDFPGKFIYNKTSIVFKN